MTDPFEAISRLLRETPPLQRYLLICHGISDEDNEMGLLGVPPAGCTVRWRPEVPSGQVLRVGEPPSLFTYTPWEEKKNL